MDPIEQENALLEQRIAQLETSLADAPTTGIQATTATATPTTAEVMESLPFYHPLKIDQAKRQLGYDISTGALKAFTGLADVITTPAVAATRQFGYDVPYFPISTMLEQDLAALAPEYGLKEKTIPQEVVSFVTPTGKGKALAQGISGLASYLGFKGAEYVAPESAGLQIAASLAAPAAMSGISRAGTRIEKVGSKLAVVPPTLAEETATLAKAIDQNVATLSQQAPEIPSKTVVDLGNKQVNNILEAKKTLKEEVTQLFKDPDVYNANVPTTGLRNDIDTIVADWSGGRKTQVANPQLASTIDELRKLERPKLGQALGAFTTEVPNEVPLGKLHSLQIKLGQALPSGSSEAFTPDEALATRLYEYIGNLIDNTPGGEKLVQAKQKSKAYRDAFVWNPILKSRAPLATAQRRDPEKVIPFLTGGSSRFDALQKAGVDITPIQAQIVNEFSAIKTPQGKLDWINKNRPVLQNAPFWSTFEDAATKLETQLGKVEPLTSQTNQLGQILGNLALGKLARVPSGGMLPLAIALGKQYGQEAVGSALQTGGNILSKIPVSSPTELLTRSVLAGTPEIQTQSLPAVDIEQENAQLESKIAELEKQFGTTKQSESIKVGKQDVSIPVGEQYAPPALVKAVMRVESAGKPKAVSEKGAAGLMQLMPGTAKDLGVEDRFNPAQNIEGGSRYLQQMINKYKKTDLALAAYNWGPSNIDKAIRKVKAEGKRVTWANIMQVVKVPMETRLYVNKVLKNKEVEAQEHNALGIWQLHKR